MANLNGTNAGPSGIAKPTSPTRPTSKPVNAGGPGDELLEGVGGIDTLDYSSTTAGVIVDMNAIDRSGNAAVAAILAGASLPTNTPVGVATGAEIGTDAFRNFENVTGGSGDDTIYGDGGVNVINGGEGADTIRGGGGNDTLDGGAGNDTLDYSDLTNSVQVNLTTGLANAGLQGGTDTVSNFENVILGAGDDQYIGSAGNDFVAAGAGNDQINGVGGSDTLVYEGTVAVDGLAQQQFNLLRFDAGANGTDTIENVERLQFINGEDVLNVIVDASGNANVASRDDAGEQTEGDTTITRTALTGALSNDVNLDQGAGDQKVVASVNGSAGNVGVAVVGTYGSLTLNADGSWTYVQNQAATNVLSEGEVVTDTFTYQADDGDLGTSLPANLVITITGVNDAPTTGGTQTGTLTEDTGVVMGNLVATGTLTVTDPDDGESSYQPQTTNNEEGFGTFVLLADGSWTYTVDNSALAVQQLGAGQTATDTFTAETVDGTEVPVTITINGTNDNPVISGVVFASPAGTLLVAADSANSTLGTAIALTAGVLDADPEIYNSTTVPHVTIVASTDGTADFYTFSFTNQGFDEPNTLITIDIDQITGATPAALTIFVDGAEFITTTVDRFGQFPLSPAFDVPSPGTLPSVQLGSGGGALSATIQIRVGSAASGGTLGLGDGNGYIMHVSIPGAAVAPAGTGNLTETNAALTTSGEVNFTDIDLNDSPVAAYDSDTDFAFELTGGPAPTAAQQEALAEAFTIDSEGAFTFNLASPDYLAVGDVLELTYTVTVTDQHGGSATTPVVITITGTNDAPVITSVAQGATLAETNAELTASGAVTASDVDVGDELSFSNVEVTINETNIELNSEQREAIEEAFIVNPDGTWTFDLASPDYLAVGDSVTATFTVSVSDGNEGTASQDVVIVINGTNDAPTIQNNEENGYSQTIAETNAALTDSGQVLFDDIDDGDTPTAEYDDETDATVDAEGITLTADQIDEITAAFELVGTDGSYTFNLASPDYLAAGDTITAVFNVHVVDGNGGDTVQAITYTITGTNDAPTLTGGSLGTIADTEAFDEFEPITGTLVDANDDIDTNDPAVFTLNDPAESDFGTLTLNEDGTYSFAVNSDAVNGLVDGETETVTYSVTVSDTNGGTSTADFTFTITGSNEDPVFETSPLQFFYNDNDGPVVADLLQGASDPDDDESDLDISNVSLSGVEINGDLTSGQFELIFEAIDTAFQTGNFSLENGTLSFDTGLFDVLDPFQFVAATITFDVTDGNGGVSQQTATINIDGTLEFNNEEATPFDDYLVGGNFGDGIDGLGGDDEIYALAGSDQVFGDDGNDLIYAGSGNDLVDGGQGDDFIDGGSDDDIVIGGEGDDELVGGAGSDVIFGDEAPFFFFFGGEGVLAFKGEKGPIFVGGEGSLVIGDNTISAGSGDDVIYGGLGNNTISGGSGNDEIYLGSAGMFFGGGEGGWDTTEPDSKTPVQIAFNGGEGGPIAVDLPSGENIVDGGTGFDTVHFSGVWSDYTITRTGSNSFTFEREIEDGSVETNVVSNVEFFVFATGEGSASELLNNGPEVAPTQTFSVAEIGDGNEVPQGGVFIGNVGATDADEGLGDVLTYSITGVGSENFTIDEDGALLLTSPIDFETDPRVYTLALTVVDAQGATATSTITVNITDLNEIGATTVTGALSAAELAVAGTVVATASAVDADPTDTVSYELTNTAGGRFAIDAMTGEITVANGNLLDFEQAVSHSVTVVSTSSDGSSSSATVAIAVTDVSPETIVGTAAAETFRAGAGSDSYATNISTSAADSVNLGDGLDRVNVSAMAPTNVRLTFTSAEVGNGSAVDGTATAPQDGGLAVRMQAENAMGNLTGPITRIDDEGVVFIGGAGVTFDVRDLISGVSRGNAFEVAILGTSANDTLTAVQNTRPYYFNAGGGDDTVTGGDASDFLVGGVGNDTLSGGMSADTFLGGSGTDTVSYQSTMDNQGAIFINLVTGQGFGNAAQGDAFTGIENVTGTSFADFIIGDAGANRLDGADGDDSLLGGLGADVLVGGAGSDTASYEDNQGAVFVDLGAGLGFGNSAAGDTFSGIENLTGGAFADFFIGNAGANVLNGGDGADTLIGGMGADTLIGGTGIDTASYEDNQGAVTVDLLAGTGTGAAAQGDTYSGIENVNGTAFMDTLIGDNDANVLDAMGGSDTLTGNGGADTFRIGAGVDTITDFLSGTDRIQLVGYGSTGTVDFVSGAGAQTAAGSNSAFLYDTTTGTLSYDADGSGAGAAVQVAVLGAGTALVASDLIIPILP